MYSCLPRLPAAPRRCRDRPADGTGVGPSDRTRVVKIIAFFKLKQKLTSFKGLGYSRFFRKGNVGTNRSASEFLNVGQQ